jgi:hypothetical protein
MMMFGEKMMDGCENSTAAVSAYLHKSYGMHYHVQIKSGL